MVSFSFSIIDYKSFTCAGGVRGLYTAFPVKAIIGSRGLRLTQQPIVMLFASPQLPDRSGSGESKKVKLRATPTRRLLSRDVSAHARVRACTAPRFSNVCRLRIIKTRTEWGRPGTEATDTQTLFSRQLYH